MRQGLYKPGIGYVVTAKCDICGRFMKCDENTISWTYFGGPTDLEPDNAAFAHPECWNKMSESEKELTRKVSWMRPSNSEVGV